jgi:hypothetical protein
MGFISFLQFIRSSYDPLNLTMPDRLKEVAVEEAERIKVLTVHAAQSVVARTRTRRLGRVHRPSLLYLVGLRPLFSSYSTVFPVLPHFAPHRYPCFSTR